MFICKSKLYYLPKKLKTSCLPLLSDLSRMPTAFAFLLIISSKNAFIFLSENYLQYKIGKTIQGVCYTFKVFKEIYSLKCGNRNKALTRHVKKKKMKGFDEITQLSGNPVDDEFHPNFTNLCWNKFCAKL